MSDLKEQEMDPGVWWKIEGYDVMRSGLRHWTAHYCGSYLTTKATLDEIREEIRKATR